MTRNPRVRVWQEPLTIPTYGVGDPDRNPMFLEKRVYQGSSGAVYPYPVIDRIDDRKHDRVWQAVFLENEYLKIMILPELGGRVQMALDKTNDHHFVYYNRVVKPALVGLAGPWISGGIEFNWPQHHRPGTFSPVDFHIERGDDGSATVWCHEIDRMHRTEATHGLTLHPDRAYLEVKARLNNRTDQAQTFLWWANPAVHVDEHHQSIFPPDVRAVMDHGKRDVSSFPIATGTYYKVDYAPGTDISRYRNIPVPTSYMAYHSDYDFVGSYDHARRAGLLHICNHHVSPGKKQWTWGTGEFGRAWDRHLTDEDGPYVELMCGVYTDNQPDFSWLAPGEQKSFSQYFMPYHGVGVIGNATLDAAVGMELSRGSATVRVHTTGEFPGATITLRQNGNVIAEAAFDASPRGFFEQAFTLPIGGGDAPITVRVAEGSGRVLVEWTPRESGPAVVPEPAKAIGEPGALDSVESLYLAGLHIEQYRHATRRAEDYYREGLRRDPGDIRCNTAMGKLLYRSGCFAEAEPHFRRAIERLTRHNPNPADGEAYYGLGLVLVKLGREAEAFDALYKATWNAAWQAAGFFELARLATRRGDEAEAKELVERCLAVNGLHQQANHLLAYLRRNDAAAAADLEREIEKAPFNFGLLYEDAVRSGRFETLEERMRGEENNFLELAIDYAAFGAHERAIAVLERYLSRAGTATTALPHYHLAMYLERCGRTEAAAAPRQLAARHATDLGFPNKLEDIAVLEAAIAKNPADGRAAYDLGNLWYDRRQHARAVACWEQAKEREPGLTTAWRNLGLAYFNHGGDGERAWAAMSRAFELNPRDARVLFELDQLARRLGHNPADRMERLKRHEATVRRRDDLYLEWVTLHNLLGDHAAALELLTTRRFHPWEGGEGKVAAQYVTALTELARRSLGIGDAAHAAGLLERALHWPENLGEGKLPGQQENNVQYLLGCAMKAAGDGDAARGWFERAGVGLSDPTSAMYYNDQPPDMIFYQGLAQRKLGREREAAARFERLVAYGREHIDDDVTIDYFAVSLPDFLVFDDDLRLKNRVHCLYMTALGLLGLGDMTRAAEAFDRVLELDPNHLGATVHRALATPMSAA